MFSFNFQTIKLGLPEEHPDSSLPPENVGQLTLHNCHQVDIHSRVINAMPDVDNITISKAHRVKMHSRVYESRQGTGKTKEMNSFELEEVRLNKC